ncbi:hypothetical protein [Candidatus Mycolicibacterium alkanivorans]|uniref:hypothetical protein n=1 Tax=Candidatus Mycolicibacterium alkanivorans TaxID=2954114 RepID=UPI003557182B
MMLLSSTLAALEVSTHQRFTGNRLAINIVTGGGRARHLLRRLLAGGHRGGRPSTPTSTSPGVRRPSRWPWRSTPDRGPYVGTGVLPVVRESGRAAAVG